MNLKLTLCLLPIVTAIIPPLSAVANPSTQCLEQAFQDLQACATHAGSNALGTIAESAGTGAGLTTIFLGPEAAPAGLAVGTGAGLVGEAWQQGQCLGEYISQRSNCAASTSESSNYDSFQNNWDVPSSVNYSRDTDGDGMPDQSYYPYSDW
ncbi:hypothetical protein IQ260_28040 [Leptolyngbya cf. ectocarpi LEGE 11479]|uniref:Uncharacterized protein n=1 Tax=Leptolyngbya cf. ectocarpi LEGE 11479 TaxID=1828722 RepID=A0A928ZZQ8_LEPEC|nr:hypothetical protein [Leptolyngbya ectocarpi]MBE9070499.1 hypothetical protein [Leptolyngbya cf. ectocarpi LEGE 11479]